jgi:hypothetical protein
VLDIDGVTPLSGVSVELKNGSGYDTTLTTDANGTVFFPNDSNPLVGGTYDLKITSDGYQENNSQINLVENILFQNTVTLSLP